MTSFYSELFSSDGLDMNYSSSSTATSPYIIYKCHSPVNINFLFREVLLCDPEYVTNSSSSGSDVVHIIPTYLDDNSAYLDTDQNRFSDVCTTYGNYYALRFINSILKTEMSLSSSEQAKLDTYIKHYGGHKFGFSVDQSVNSSVNDLATLDFGEFFQVALSAIRNKNTNAYISAMHGLVDRENINNAAVADDIFNRTVDNNLSSNLLSSILNSSIKSGTYADGNVVDSLSSVNWMKQIVYSIVLNSTTLNGGYGYYNLDNRYRYIKRSNISGNNYEKFIQLNLKDGDSLVLVFKFNLSDSLGGVFNIDRPDDPGVPMTIGFKIEHSSTAPDFVLSETGATDGLLPIGWATSSYDRGVVISQKITPSNLENGQHYGTSVSIGENYLVVGAPDENRSIYANNGVVYVYTKVGNSFTNEYIIPCSINEQNVQFGESVDVYDDVIAISAIGEVLTASKIGAVYVYRYINSIWTLDDKFTYGPNTSGNIYGNVIKLSNNILFVGFEYNLIPNSDIGVDIYFYSGGVWSLNHTIGGLIPTSLSYYNNRILIGCTVNSVDSVYLYSYDGSIWDTGVEVIAPTEIVNGDGFGLSVCLYDNTIVVGSFYSEGGLSNSGAVYTYEILSNNNIVYRSKLVSPNPEVDANFGTNVSMFKNILFISSPLNDTGGTSNSGIVYKYQFLPEYQSWSSAVDIKSSDYNGVSLQVDDYFGSDVVVYKNFAAIGSYNNSNNSYTNNGSTYLIKLI